MEQKAVLEAIVKALDSKRAEDIQVIGVKNLTILGDYFVIANGTSTTHTKTLADEVGSYWIIMILLSMCSIRKPEHSTSWNGFGQTAKRWM